MKKTILILAMLMLVTVNYCFAQNVSLNDDIKYQDFAQIFNINDTAKQFGVKIYMSDTDYYNNKNKYITYYTTNQMDAKDNVLILQSELNGDLYELDIFVTVKDDFKKAQEILFKETMIAQHVFGLPSGDASFNGTAAILDALEKGKGTYWSNETNRRYVVLPNGYKDDNGNYRIGLILFAEI